MIKRLTNWWRRRQLRGVVDDSGMYEVAAGLRGPDYPGSYYLKSIFTARIRSLVGMSPRMGVMVRDYPINMECAVGAIGELRKHRDLQGHYMNHIANALLALSAPRCLRDGVELIIEVAALPEGEDMNHGALLAECVNREFDS